jgi:hypothetical protein
MEAVFAFVNVSLAGDMPEWEELRASRLAPLLRKGGGIRPTAIGDMWVRLISMCAMAACPSVGPSLPPLQVGVGVRGGAKCLGHAFRAGVPENPDDVTLQFNFKNAFNKLSQEVMLKTIAERSPYAQVCSWDVQAVEHSMAASNTSQRFSYLVDAGVRQGDQSGAALLCPTTVDLFTPQG